MLVAIWSLLVGLVKTFSRIEVKLDRVLALLEPNVASRITFSAVVDGKIQIGVTKVQLRDDQKVALSISITDKKGKPAPVDGVPVWASSDETVVTVVASDDGMSAVASGVAPGDGRVVVTADADLGAGVTPITGTLDVTVVGGGATSIAITAGEPEDQ